MTAEPIRLKPEDAPDPLGVVRPTDAQDSGESLLSWLLSDRERVALRRPRYGTQAIRFCDEHLSAGLLRVQRPSRWPHGSYRLDEHDLADDLSGDPFAFWRGVATAVAFCAVAFGAGLYLTLVRP